jgi:hypothetical protein
MAPLMNESRRDDDAVVLCVSPGAKIEDGTCRREHLLSYTSDNYLGCSQQEAVIEIYLPMPRVESLFTISG